jgi:hypothetical protein
MLPEQLLVLNHDELCKKVSSLMDDLTKSEALRNLFIENPTEVISKRVWPLDQGEILSPQIVSNSNKFLYTVLANNEFYEWLKKYQKDIIERFKNEPGFDKTTIYLEFVEAFAEYGDPDFLTKTLRFLADPENPIEQLTGPRFKVVMHIYVAALVFLLLVVIDLTVVNPTDDCNLQLTPSDIKIISDLMTDYANRFTKEID